VPEVLNRGGDDAAAACGANYVVQRVVGEEFDDCGRDGGEGAFAGLNEVGWGGDVAECVGFAGGGEIAHFVVHDDAGFWDAELRPGRYH